MEGINIEIESRIKSLLQNDEEEFDQYEQLFKTIIHISEIINKKQPIYREHNVKEEDIKTKYESTKKLLLHVIPLMFDGSGEIIINLTLEIEYNKYLTNSNVSSFELNELLLSKILIILLFKGNYNNIYSIIIFLCSSSVYRRLFTSEFLEIVEGEYHV